MRQFVLDWRQLMFLDRLTPECRGDLCAFVRQMEMLGIFRQCRVFHYCITSPAAC
jgi:hypothetical protein